MATYQILYWQEIPAQIRVEDGSDKVNLELPLRFQKRIDVLAGERGATETDAYLEGWNWSEFQERPGRPHAVAQALLEELESQFFPK